MDEGIREALAKVLAASRRGVTARVNDNDRRQADAVMNVFLVAPRGRHAIVELPTAATDDFGDPRWPVSEVDKFATVKLDEHGRVASLGVGNPASPKLALRQAAAMIAAARHVQSAD